jgi:hypothetical protein
VGGSWGEIGELARLAEPHQNAPIPPWRWVGWNGDAGHGRGNHLHLSWAHSPAKPRHTARVVYTRKCPKTDGQEPQRRRHRHRGSNGGTSPTGDGGSPPNGGIPASAKIAPVVPDY